MTTHLWPQTNPQQFVSAGSGRNPWAVPAAQTKPTSAPTKPKPPPSLPKSEFLQLEPKVSTPTPVVQSMVAPGPKPQQKHKAPPEAAPEDFVQLRGGRGWGTAVTKPAPVVPVTKKKIVPVVAPATAVVTTPAPAAPAPVPQVTEEENTSQSLYKTELCRSFEETGTCRYGAKCQFAHGRAELRPVLRHPKYKTEVCKTFHTIGTCPYGKRCRFIHSPAEAATTQAPATPAVTEVAPVTAQQPKVPAVLLETIEWSTSWTGNAPAKTTPRSTPLSSPTKATQAVPAVPIQKTATPVFPAPESKPITSEGFLPATTVFMPSFPARDFVELSPKKTIPIEEAIVAAVTDPSVFPTAPVVVPLDTTSPRSVVATVPPPVVDDEDAEDEEALARRLSIFAQICSNDD